MALSTLTLLVKEDGTSYMTLSYAIVVIRHTEF